MHHSFSYTNSFIILFLVLMGAGCNTDAQYKSPPGYNFSKPNKDILPLALHEISGIAMVQDSTNSMIAIEDEDGKIFSLSFNDKKIEHSKFGKKGDYEDVAIVQQQKMVVLRSDGSLFAFDREMLKQKKFDSVQVYEHILPEGEYEGLYADSGKLYALCKDCAGDKQKKEVSVYELVSKLNDSLAVVNTFKIDLPVDQYKAVLAGEKFHPSGLAKSPVTQQWYVISSVNKLLLVLDKQWKAEMLYQLDPAVFKQPEGICFNASGDLYISNEGGEGAANILLFQYLPN